jgi:hypothetical protein
MESTDYSLTTYAGDYVSEQKFFYSSAESAAWNLKKFAWSATWKPGKNLPPYLLDDVKSLWDGYGAKWTSKPA